MVNPESNILRFPRTTAFIAAGMMLTACSEPEFVESPGLEQFVTGCDPFTVYSQNRFEPYGTAVRTELSVKAPKSEEIAFAPNEVITVDGWTRTGEVAYPTNPEPIRTDIWFHLKNADGYVSFAGVRGAPTANDETGGFSPDLGTLAELPPECEYQIDN